MCTQKKNTLACAHEIKPTVVAVSRFRLFMAMGSPVQMWNRMLLIFLFINLEVSMSIQAICTSKTCCTLVFFRFLYFEASNGLMVSYFIFLQITFARKIYLGKAIRNSFPRTDCDSFLFCLKVLSPNHPTFCLSLTWKLKVMRTSILNLLSLYYEFMTCFNNLILLDGLSFALLFGKPFQWLQASVLYCWMVCQGLNFFILYLQWFRRALRSWSIDFHIQFPVWFIIFLPASHTITHHSGHLVTGMQGKAVYQ